MHKRDITFTPSYRRSLMDNVPPVSGHPEHVASSSICNTSGHYSGQWKVVLLFAVTLVSDPLCLNIIYKGYMNPPLMKYYCRICQLINTTCKLYYALTIQTQTLCYNRIL